MAGLKRGKVKLVPYSPDWAEIFKKERKMLENTLKDMVIDIQHVGSTAIPKFPAKPIIDIAVAVSDLSGKKVEKYIKPLEKLDYEYRGEERPNKYTREHLFVKGSEKKRTCHLHMVEFNSKVWKNYLLFRDYLRTHHEISDKYMKLKLELAEKFSNDRKSYTIEKEKFIKEVFRKLKVLKDF